MAHLFTSVTEVGYKGILLVLMLIARRGLRKPCNPIAITTRLIDITGTEKDQRPRDRQGERGEIADLHYFVLQ